MFEYGSGASTLWLADRADEIHSVEHHRGFVEMIGQELAKRPNVTVRIVEPVTTPNPVVGSAKEGRGGLDFAEYVNSIDEAGGSSTSS